MTPTLPDAVMTLPVVHAASRWAELVTRNVDCPVDPRTLSIWARFVGLSVPTLRSRCAAIGVGAKVSLDFSRLLRAIARSDRLGTDPLVELDVCDVRTLHRLLHALNISGPITRLEAPTLTVFLETQRLVRHREAMSCVAADWRIEVC